LVLINLSVSVHAQEMKVHIQFNRLQTIKDSEFEIASMVNYGKLLKTNDSLMIINSKKGQTTPVLFPLRISISKIKQVRIKSKVINYLIVSAQTMEIDNSIFNYHAKLFIISIEGQTVRQITDDNFFTSDWVVNKQVGYTL